MRQFPHWLMYLGGNQQAATHTKENRETVPGQIVLIGFKGAKYCMATWLDFCAVAQQGRPTHRELAAHTVTVTVVLYLMCILHFIDISSLHPYVTSHTWVGRLEPFSSLLCSTTPISVESLWGGWHGCHIPVEPRQASSKLPRAQMSISITIEDLFLPREEDRSWRNEGELKKNRYTAALRPTWTLWMLRMHQSVPASGAHGRDSEAACQQQNSRDAADLPSPHDKTCFFQVLFSALHSNTNQRYLN